jgi:hypothetical protein
MPPTEKYPWTDEQVDAFASCEPYYYLPIDSQDRKTAREYLRNLTEAGIEVTFPERPYTVVDASDGGLRKFEVTERTMPSAVPLAAFYGGKAEQYAHEFCDHLNAEVS